MTCVRDLHYVALGVPNLAAEAAFFDDVWGLEKSAEADGSLYYAAAASSLPYVIRLRQSDERRTELISFAAGSCVEVDALFRQVVDAGAKLIGEPAPASSPAGGYGFRFFDPEGRAIEVISDVARREPRTLRKGEAIPVGLSHVVLHSPKQKELAAFYEQALGFRVSDWIGEFMVFLRCNPVHHRLAILPGPPALNHIAFDVSSVDELMRGLARLTARGVPLQWGPGRHTAGNNTFTYYLTPNGNSAEYTSDLEEVDEAAWTPTTYEFRPDITDQWGTGRIMPGNTPHGEVKPDAGLWQVPA